jgi:hypothetical protein
MGELLSVEGSTHAAIVGDSAQSVSEKKPLARLAADAFVRNVRLDMVISFSQTRMLNIFDKQFIEYR